MHRLRTAAVSAALVSIIAIPSGGTARARQASPSVFSDVMRSAWYEVNELLLSAARKMPDEHYTFRPVKEARTFGEIVAHVAGDHYAICGAVTGRPALTVTVQQKDALLKALEDSSAVCDMAYGLLTDENAAFRYTVFNMVGTRLSLLTAVISHDNEHYGNLATYMRIKGLTPPAEQQ
jgi:uncharacterized damage-inducible protein DinB